MLEKAKKVADAARKIIDYRMIWRWHFYAGLVCLPFIVILSITGPIYLFKPQIEAMIDQPYDHLVFSGAPQTVAAQVAAAESANPGWKFKTVEVRRDLTDAARITLSQKGEKLRVYVHPQSLAILKQVPEDGRFMEIVKTIHGELLSGHVGEVIVELAASWAIVMILTGLYLWWPRSAEGLRGVLWPRFKSGSRIFWRDLHAVTGIYVSVFALFLLLTGLPWTYVWGNGLKALRAQPAAEARREHASHEHVADTKAPDWAQDRADEHKMVMAGMPGMTDLSRLDPIADKVRKLDLPAPVLLSPPEKSAILWTAQSDTGNRPLRVALKIASDTLEVVSIEDFKGKRVIDKIVGVGIAAHEGQLFGPLNQALGVLTAAGLLTLCLSAIVMWWKRRPNDALGAPAILPDERLGPGLAILIIVLGIFLPVLGVSLVIIGLVERLILRRIQVVRNWLVLKGVG